MRNLQTFAHELGHGIAALADANSDGQIAIKNENRTFACWSRQSFTGNISRAGFIAAGPFVDMMAKGIITPDTTIGAARDALFDFLKVSADGSTTDDSASFFRAIRRLESAEIDAAIAIALLASVRAFRLARMRPAFIETMTMLVEKTPEDQAVIFTREAIEAAERGTFPVQVQRHWFGNWLNEGQDDNTEMELLADAMGLFAEMAERGEIDSNGITQKGLARLALNER